ncbi:MAG: hypothetical protein ACK559_25915, partial [bacterium]
MLGPGVDQGHVVAGAAHQRPRVAADGAGAHEHDPWRVGVHSSLPPRCGPRRSRGFPSIARVRLPVPGSGRAPVPGRVPADGVPRVRPRPGAGRKVLPGTGIRRPCPRTRQHAATARSGRPRASGEARAVREPSCPAPGGPRSG